MADNSLDIFVKTHGDPKGAQQVASALNQVTAATQKCTEATKVRTAAEVDAFVEQEKEKQLLGLMDAGLEKNAKATEKVTSKKKSLIESLKVLKQGLGDLPGMWQAMAVIKNPVTAAMVAIAMAIGYVSRAIKEANEAARDIKSLDDFAERMEGMGTTMKRVAREQGTFEAGLERIGTEAETAASHLKDLNTEAELLTKQENELTDKAAEADIAAIKADATLTEPQKTAAVAARKKQQEDDKEARKQFDEDQEINRRSLAAEMSYRAGIKAAAEAAGLRPQAADAAAKKRIADTAASRAGGKLDTDGQKIQDEITDMEGLLAAAEAGPGLERLMVNAQYGSGLFGGISGLRKKIAQKKSDLSGLRGDSERATQRAEVAGAEDAEIQRKLKDAESRAAAGIKSGQSLDEEQSARLSAISIRDAYRDPITAEVEKRRAAEVDLAGQEANKKAVDALKRGTVGKAVVGGAAALGAANPTSEQKEELAVLRQLLNTVSGNTRGMLNLIQQSSGDAEALAARITELEAKLRVIRAQNATGAKLNRGG